MFVWTAEMSVGVRELDDQHRHLFERVNALLTMLDRRERADALAFHRLLDDIMNYNAYHIRAEESYMHEFECIDTDHLAAHAWYIEQITGLFDAASGAIRSASPEAIPTARSFAAFAGNWHVRHIVGQDRNYTECFQSHGLR